VVDDNQINRLILREMIAGCGAEVDEADSGEGALEAVFRTGGRSYDIILLDARMPGMDGPEVARRIRERELAIEPIILMLSSDDLKPQLAVLKNLGLDAYLVKPITRTELFEAIHTVLEKTYRRMNPMPRVGSARGADTAADQARSMRILVAEDSPDSQLLIRAYLRREPHTVDIAENGRVAVDKFTSQAYDLVFMDIHMPELDGLDATRIIRAWEKYHGSPPVPIIALSASVLEEDVQHALAAGCTAHIGKPVRKELVLDAVRASGRLQPTNPQAAVGPARSATPGNPATVAR
jgi:CheY-like chemotaxis protein